MLDAAVVFVLPAFNGSEDVAGGTIQDKAVGKGVFVFGLCTCPSYQIEGKVFLSDMTTCSSDAF